MKDALVGVMEKIESLKDSMTAKMDVHESNTKEAMAQANINATEMSKIKAEVHASNEQAIEDAKALAHREAKSAATNAMRAERVCSPQKGTRLYRTLQTT